MPYGVKAEVEDQKLTEDIPIATKIENHLLVENQYSQTPYQEPFETWTAEMLQDFIDQNSCLENIWENNVDETQLTSRNEFTQALNNCIQAVDRDLPDKYSDANNVNRWPILQNTFNNTQATLVITGDELEKLQERVQELENNAFSTTTKFIGEAIFAYSNLSIDKSPRLLSRGTANGSDLLGLTDNDDAEAVFGSRGRVTLNTSFSGEDKLLIRITTSNLAMFDDANELTGRGIPNGEAITGETTQTFNLGANTATFKTQNFTVAYSFPVSDAAKVHVFGAGGIWSDFVPTLNPYFEDYDGGNGALSLFASNNPIYRIGGGSGVGINYDLKFFESIFETATFSAGYLAPQGFQNRFGLFEGDYSLLLQTDFRINNRLAFGLTYNHAYHPSNTAVFDMGGLGNQGVVGTQLANSGAAGAGSPKITNSYGMAMAWQPSDAVSFSGFLTYTNGDVLGSRNAGDYESWTYGLGLAFPNLFKEGGLLGLFAGAQPYVAGFDSPTLTFRNDIVPYHFEVFYRYPVNEFISITPGMIFYSAPNQIDAGAHILTLRTTFKF
ncbi:iron uptake porin [[Leptolyngbya] sp. PCC 7376]|uniref:iron uptake porin n=1 Tax=[Leptolyngbya] sp. PCC 7376 TaxID=111781 RepID=UPI00030A8803|nr:iron uptake porin [[Leptolyngbya] sp. PCC 7376]